MAATPSKAVPAAAKTTATQSPATKAPATKTAATKASPSKATPSKATPSKATVSTATDTVEPAASELHWTKAELAGFRTELVEELQGMQAEYDRSMAELNELHQAGTDGAGDDQADAGSKTFEREQELSIAANRLDLLNQIQRAIERVDAGTYGLCESCGKPIPKARLKAFPMATLDVVCKQREERR
jgi:RNA polymerase-binding protein DksA